MEICLPNGKGYDVLGKERRRNIFKFASSKEVMLKKQLAASLHNVASCTVKVCTSGREKLVFFLKLGIYKI